MEHTARAKVGANIRAEMARKNVSQMTLADQIGKSQAAISARLRGLTPVDIDELESIAQYLGVPLSTLTAGVGPIAAGAPA